MYCRSLAASLASTLQVPIASFPYTTPTSLLLNCDYKKSLQTLPNAPQRTKLPPVENHCLRCSIFMQCHCLSYAQLYKVTFLFHLTAQPKIWDLKLDCIKLQFMSFSTNLLGLTHFQVCQKILHNGEYSMISSILNQYKRTTNT